MKAKKNVIITSLVALVLPAVFATSDWGRTSFIIDVRNKEGIGRYLVDSEGMTLYNNRKDSRGRSDCTGECVAMWPVFYSEYIAVHRGLRASDFGTTTREDGRKQTTYKGMPLYYFAGDEKPGDTNGDGLYDIWVPASPTGIPGNLPSGDYR